MPKVSRESSSMNNAAQNYFDEGCGRCAFHATPQCKVNTWKKELALLRKIARESGLQEVVQWGAACYTFEQRNVIMLGAFKQYCVMSFFKGALLKDPDNLLQKAGEQSQATRVARFTNVKDIQCTTSILKSYLQEAIDLEKSNAKVVLKKIEEYEIPAELQTAFATSPTLKAAFDSLTSGRRRGYLLHFYQAKKSETRSERIKKCTPQIMQGKGLQD